MDTKDEKEKVDSDIIEKPIKVMERAKTASGLNN
jgi:hypothetical protein